MNLVAQIDKEIASHQAKIEKLKVEIGWLESARATLAGKLSTGDTTKPMESRHRAPMGYLEEQIEKVLGRKEGMQNSQIREALVKNGYTFSLSPLHVGKTLTRMVDAKRINVVRKGPVHLYTLSK